MASLARFGALVSLTLVFGIAAASAAEGDGMAGRTYALQNCAECHNVGAGRQQPIHPGQAPDFTAIANAPTTTPLGLEVFLTTPHAKMPNFMISEIDRGNIIAYIATLRRKPKGGAR